MGTFLRDVLIANSSEAEVTTDIKSIAPGAHCFSVRGSRAVHIAFSTSGSAFFSQISTPRLLTNFVRGMGCGPSWIREKPCGGSEKRVQEPTSDMA